MGIKVDHIGRLLKIYSLLIFTRNKIKNKIPLYTCAPTNVYSRIIFFVLDVKFKILMMEGKTRIKKVL